MPFIKEINNKNVVCRFQSTGKRSTDKYYDWFSVKFQMKDKGVLNLKGITFPKEFIGKRIQLIVREVRKIPQFKKKLHYKKDIGLMRSLCNYPISKKNYLTRTKSIVTCKNCKRIISARKMWR